MRKYFSLLILVSLVAFSASCGKKRYRFNGDQGSASTEADGSGLIVDVDWVKNKGDSIDVLLYIKNTYDHPVVIQTKSYKAEYHGQTYALTGLNRPEEFAPNTTEKKTLIFKADKKIPKKGTVILTIDPIHEGEIDKMTKKLKPIKLQLPLE